MSQAQLVAARTLLQLVGVADTTILIAISFCESGGDPDAAGDCGLGEPSCGPCTYGGEGATSFGLFQVHLPAWYPYLETVTGSQDACDWAAWLKQPTNAARAAAHILRTQGLKAWSSYNSGCYRAHLAAAAAIVAEAVGASVVTPGTASTPPATALTGAIPAAGPSPVLEVAVAAGIGLLAVGVLLRGLKRM